MDQHNHLHLNDCHGEHRLRFCKTCHVVYCLNCRKEWGEQFTPCQALYTWIHWPGPYFTYTDTTGSIGASPAFTSAGAANTGSTCSHSGS